MSAPVLIDFESQSRADLDAIGGRRYWGHPSTEALCVVWYDTATAAGDLWLPGAPWPHEGRVLVAHNADQFDRFGAERYGFRAAGWCDSSHAARRAGLPGALDALGERWCGTPKDAEGSQFTRALSSVTRPKAVPAAVWKGLDDVDRRTLGVLPTVTPEALARVVRYCASDVAIMVAAWPRLAPWLTVDTEAERACRAVNERGIDFDTELARHLLRCCEEHAERVTAATAAAIGWSTEDVRRVAGSPAQCAEALGTADARKATLRGAEHPLVAARQAVAGIARGKLLAGLARVSPDERLRDMMVYHAAHTGRWASQGMQLHNLPKPEDVYERWTDDDICRAADEVTRGGPADPALVNLLLRATLCADTGRLVVRDFIGVEARGLAWAARDEDALAVFASGRNPYFVAASTIFGVPYESITKGTHQYAVGKIAELALGYGQGDRKFAETARVQGGVDLAAAGVSAKDVVTSWRRAHHRTVAFWRELERGFRAALEGTPTAVGPYTFAPGAADEVALFLPSGRPVVYPEPRLSPDGRLLTYHGTGADPKMLRAVCPTHHAAVSLVHRCATHGQVTPVGSTRRCPECRGATTRHGWCEWCGTEVDFVWRTHVYAGKIAENATQALCYDLMVDALVRAEDDGLCPVLSVHDEIACEVPTAAVREAEEHLQRIMVTVPSWAARFPVGAAGFVGRRYRK